MDASKSATDLPSSEGTDDTSCSLVKSGVLLKRHRHKNSWISRVVQLNSSTGLLSYFAPKQRQLSQRLKMKFTNAPEKGSPVASEQPEGEADLKRALPVADIHACIISLEGGRSDDGEDTKVLLISYSEAIAASQSGQGASTTRSVFFVSSKEAGSPEAEEDLQSWLHEIQTLKSSVCRSSSTQDLSNIGETVIQCGWIHKKGSMLNSKWQKRWLFFDSRTGKLRYYKSPLEALPQGEILLESCLSIKKGMPDLFPEPNVAHAFTVVCGARNYWMRTESLETTTEWLDTLSSYVPDGDSRMRVSSISSRLSKCVTIDST